MGRQYTGVYRAEKDGVTKQLVVKKLIVLLGEKIIIKKVKRNISNEGREKTMAKG